MLPIIRTQDAITDQKVHEWLQFFLKEYNRLFGDCLLREDYDSAIKSSARPLPSLLFKGNRNEVGWVLYSLLQSVGKMTPPSRQ